MILTGAPGHGGTVTPCHGSGWMTTIDGLGGMMTEEIGSIGTTVTHGGHGVDLTLHHGKGSGLTLIFTGCGHGGTLMLGLGTGGMRDHGLGGVVKHG